MPRYALRVEYHGGGFVGWQRQDAGVSVQSALEDAAAHLAHAEPPALAAAGRTDAGVHAEAQVAQLDLDREMPPDKLRDALNFHLRPHAVSILAAAVAPEGWHARFSAIGRGYRYRILNRPAPPALEVGLVWHVPLPLDASAMHAAAQVLCGRHDFTSFRAASCQAAGPIRTLDRLDVSRRGAEIVIVAAARSFLHHQVRNMVGTLKLVGEGRWPPGRVAAALEARARAAAGPTAPPQGLCLTVVRYPPELDPWA
jgi:tRNA pseudouridine38-40 synthase